MGDYHALQPRLISRLADLADALGSVRQMTDPAGTVTLARNYDPYGVVTYTGGTSSTAYGFTGEPYGESTQLLYLRAEESIV